MSADRRFVYILKSLVARDEYYVGSTSDVEHRLRAHTMRVCHTTPRGIAHGARWS